MIGITSWWEWIRGDGQCFELNNSDGGKSESSRERGDEKEEDSRGSKKIMWGVGEAWARGTSWGSTTM